MNTRRLSLLTLACTALAGHGIAQAQEEQGRVISSTPVIQQVAVPRQVCSDEVVTYEGRSSGAGALLGAVAGGAAGNAIGNGGGRAAATVIGLIGGAMLGDRIEGRGPAQSETITRCGTQTMYEPRTVTPLIGFIAMSALALSRLAAAVAVLLSRNLRSPFTLKSVLGVPTIATISVVSICF